MSDLIGHVTRPAATDTSVKGNVDVWHTQRSVSHTQVKGGEDELHLVSQVVIFVQPDCSILARGGIHTCWHQPQVTHSTCTDSLT